ncbi:hypothetical protein ACC672_37005, partial [Rhizobium ruizarguesonis]
EPFTLYGLLAETVELDDDRSFIQFNLNPKAKWADGQPVRRASRCRAAARRRPCRTEARGRGGRRYGAFGNP